MTPNRPYLIGLTGGIACGKSHLAASLMAQGATVIDADAISRALTAPGGAALPFIRERFGQAVFDDQVLNRQRLSENVFKQPEALSALNAIMHPMVFGEIDRLITQNQHQPAIIIDVPLLYETGFESRCDEVWSAWAPEAAQIKRLMERGLTEADALRRIRSQMPAMEKARRADHVIITTGQKADSARDVTRLWEAALRRKRLV